MRISYFGHDTSDAAIRKRVHSFQDCGYDVRGFMNKRFDGPPLDWENVDLGETENGAYFDRLWSVFRGAFRAAKHKQTLAGSDLIVARNLDMLATAFLTKKLTGLATPVVYESLDIHHLLCRKDIVGWVFRKFEGAFLKRSRGVIVSSPAFIREHFDRHHAGNFRAFMVENRLSAKFSSSVSRPSEVNSTPPGAPLRVGWVGILRCQRTLNLMARAAKAFGAEIEIHVHGKPDLTQVPDFHETVSTFENITFHGAYSAPEGLPDIYGGLDLIWSGDFMDAGLNSDWLLPCRLYEGGYFAVPAIAVAGTETSRWVNDHETGFLVAEPIEESLIETLRNLIANRDDIRTRSQTLIGLPDAALIEPDGFIADLLDQILDIKTATTPKPIALGQPDQA